MLETLIEPEHSLGIETTVARLRRGEPDAFDELLTRYQNRLYRYLLRLVGQPSKAEDLFQQTWLRVMTQLHRFDDRRPFAPWLFAVARNLAIDHLRKTAPDSLEERPAAAIEAREPSAYERILARERKHVLTTKMAALPAVYREALTLRFEEEMTFPEMASLLGKPVSTVKSRVQRAVEALRSQMKEMV